MLARKKAVSILFWLVALLPFLSPEVNAQGCGPQNPNCVVPTPAHGTSNNQAASTAFVQQALNQLAGGTNGQIQFNNNGGLGGFTASGDVQVNASTGVVTIQPNVVSNVKMATMPDGTIKSNISGGPASPSDNAISAVLDKLFGTVQGSMIYRDASSWAALSPGSIGQTLTSGGPAANPSWTTAPGTGTVTTVQISSGNGVATSGTCTITSSGTCTLTIDQTAWTAFSASPTCSGATFTTNSARYKNWGKVVFWERDISVASGTCAAGNIPFTMPFTSQSGGSGTGFEFVTQGTVIPCWILASSTTLTCRSSASLAATSRFVVSGVFERQ